MAQEKIRPRYVGLLNFLSRIFSLFVGLAFTVAVSRRLPVEIFGVWQYFSSILSYFVIPASVINFWATREAGREKTVGRTTMQLSFLISILSLLFFIVLVNLFVTANVSNSVIYAFALWIVSYFVATSAEAVNYGFNPTLNAVASVIFEFSKLILGILLVVILNLSLLGAVLSIVAAFFLEFAFFILMNPKTLSGSFEYSLVKKWLSNAWLPLVSALPGFIASSDIVLFLPFVLGYFNLNPMVPIAYFKAALIFGSVVGYAGAISFAIYPKILKEGVDNSKSYIEDIISLTNMFGIPMMVGAVILSEPLLCIFREDYGVAKVALAILAVSNLLGANRSIFTSILLGSEKADESIDSFSEDLAKSLLFKVPVIDSLNSLLYVLTFVPVAFLLASFNVRYEYFATAMALCNLLWNLFFTFYYFTKVKAIVKLDFPKSLLAKYFFSSLLMALVLILMYPKTAVSEKLLLVVSGVFPAIAIGAIVYFSFLLLIDENTRALAKKVVLFLFHSLNLK